MGILGCQKHTLNADNAGRTVIGVCEVARVAVALTGQTPHLTEGAKARAHGGLACPGDDGGHLSLLLAWSLREDAQF